MGNVSTIKFKECFKFATHSVLFELNLNSLVFLKENKFSLAYFIKYKTNCQQQKFNSCKINAIEICFYLLYLLGASMFKAIEGEVDLKRMNKQNYNMAKIRGDITTQLWNITLQLNNFNQTSFISE